MALVASRGDSCAGVPAAAGGPGTRRPRRPGDRAGARIRRRRAHRGLPVRQPARHSAGSGAMNSVLLSVHAAAVRYRRREVFRDLTFDVRTAQSLGVLGPSGAGKTTLLRMLIGCIAPVAGDVRIAGFRPRDAVQRTNVAYFAGAATLPPSVRA